MFSDTGSLPESGVVFSSHSRRIKNRTECFAGGAADTDRSGRLSVQPVRPGERRRRLPHGLRQGVRPVAGEEPQQNLQEVSSATDSAFASLDFYNYLFVLVDFPDEREQRGGKGCPSQCLDYFCEILTLVSKPLCPDMANGLGRSV